MKRLIQIAAFSILLSFGSALLFSTRIPAQAAPAGAKSAHQLDEQTRRAMIETLEDERRSEAQYQAVIDKFGEVRPFINIVKAERRHQAMLLELFAKYNVEIPGNEIPEQTSPATVREACEAAVRAEKDNIAIYDKFLKDVKEPDIHQVFTMLRDASKLNHLPAFERCAAGRGQGRGHGRK